MTAESQVPEIVATYGRQLAELVASVSGGRLAGAYLHGSAALGGWVASRSDVDILIVLRDASSKAALTAVEQVLTEQGPGCPGTGLECSVVSVAQAATPSPPWPFLVHLQASHGEAPLLVDGDTLEGDRDLLMHYSVCRSAGFPLHGPEPRGVFGPVSRPAVLEYLVDELRWGIAQAPAAYAVLNACRALIFASSGDLVSKITGGQLAIDHDLGPAGVINRALDEQRGLSGPRPMTPETSAFMERAIKALDSEARREEG